LQGERSENRRQNVEDRKEANNKSFNRAQDRLGTSYIGHRAEVRFYPLFSASIRVSSCFGEIQSGKITMVYSYFVSREAYLDVLMSG